MASGNLDEEISEAVRQYPCIYDKSKKGHCDRDLLKNCWVKVAEQVGLEDGESAKRVFTNLKKRFNKARSDAVNQSGDSRKDAVDKRKKYEELSFLRWLEPFILLRGTRTNVVVPTPPSPPSIHSSEGDSDVSSTYSEQVVSKPTVEIKPKKLVSDIGDLELQDDFHATDENCEDDLFSSMKSLKPSILSPKTSISGSGKRNCITETPISKTKTRKISETTGREKWNKKKDNIDDAQLSFFKTVEKSLINETANKTVSNEDHNNANDVFGRYIACELKQLNLREQRIAKHEMENVLFKIQMHSDSQTQQNMNSIPAQHRQYSTYQATATAPFHNLNYSGVLPQNQQYAHSSQNQQYAVSSQSFPSYGVPSCQQYAASTQSFPSYGVPTCQQEIPTYSAQNSTLPNPNNENDLQRSACNITEHYSDVTE